MRTLLAFAGLLLFAVSGILFLSHGGWMFLLSCFAGMAVTLLGLKRV